MLVGTLVYLPGLWIWSVHMSRIPVWVLHCLGSSLGHAFLASVMIISHSSAVGGSRSPCPCMCIYIRLQVTTSRAHQKHVLLEIHHSQRRVGLGQDVWVNPTHPLYAWWIATISNIHVLTRRRRVSRRTGRDELIHRRRHLTNLRNIFC